MGLVLRGNEGVWTAVFAASVGILGALCVINIIGSVIISRKFAKMNMREMYDYLDGVRIKAQGDIDNARKKTVGIVVAAYIYLAVVFVLICLSAFACGKADFVSDAVTPILLVALYLMWGIADIICKPIETDVTQLEVELTDSEFPLICKTVERAAAAAGYNGKIKLFLVGSEVSVSSYRGTAYITIGYKEAASFTQKELYAVMLHEFAHIANADVRRAARLVHIRERWDTDGISADATFIAKLLLFKCISQAVAYNIEMYRTFSSIGKEQAADELVKRLDGGGSFANAIAKSEFISKYDKVPVPETEYYFFESEVQPTDYATVDHRAFLKYCDKYGKVWRDELENELSPRVGTHPTARMRIQSFGGDLLSCDACAAEPDPMYVVEQQRVLERADAYITERTRNNYAEQREQAYVQRRAAIDELDRAEAAGGDLKGAARETALMALLGIDDDRALAVADRMIADDDRAPCANFAKGYVYRRRHDDRCVDCFKNATAEPSYAEDAFTLIGEYALLTGNQKLLDEYRLSIPDVMQTAQDKIKDREFTRNTATAPCDLDISVISELADKLNGATGNSIKKLYVSKYIDPDGVSHYPFAFDMTRKAAIRSNNNMGIYYDIYDVLQSYNDEPSFVMCNPNMGMMRNVRRAAGVIVYDCVNKKTVEK